MPDLSPDLAELERLLAEYLTAIQNPATGVPAWVGSHARWHPLAVAAVNALPALLAERERLREALLYIADTSASQTNESGCLDFPDSSCAECDGTGLWCVPCIAHAALEGVPDA